jgi:hypothetical protein
MSLWSSQEGFNGSLGTQERLTSAKPPTDPHPDELQGPLDKWDGQSWLPCWFHLQDEQQKLLYWAKQQPGEHYYVELGGMYDVRSDGSELSFSYASSHHLRLRAASAQDCTRWAEALKTLSSGLGAAAPQLPSGWKSSYDHSKGKPFYYNRATGEKSWRHPATTAAASTSVAAGARSRAGASTTSFADAGAPMRHSRIVALEDEIASMRAKRQQRRARRFAPSLRFPNRRALACPARAAQYVPRAQPVHRGGTGRVCVVWAPP